jgi:hypothetical protein
VDLHSTDSDLRERSFGELTKQLSEDVSTLVRQEIALARAEMTQKGKQAGKGLGMLGGAGVIALAAVGALTAFFILVLDTWMPAWLAALIVTAVYGVAAAVLARRGRDEVGEAGAPVPEQTKESVKEDVQWAKTQARSGRTS